MRNLVVLAVVVSCVGMCMVNAKPMPVTVEPGDYLFPRTFVRGDVNRDGAHDIGDTISLLGWMFAQTNTMDTLCKEGVDVTLR